MKNAIKVLLVLIVPVMVATSCKKDVSENDPGKPTGGSGTKPPVENAYNNVVETKPPVQKGITINVNGNIGGYQQALPALYDSTTKRYPLLVFIHGIGELGDGSTQLYNAANVGVARLIKDKKFPPNFVVNSKNFSFIVISPQIKKWDYTTVAKDVNDMITFAINKYRIDTTRIYVSGLSMGGGYTWDYAGTYASRIAAIAPICGASGPNDSKVKTIANAKLPVWAFHNDDDGTVASSNSKNWVSKINALNPPTKARLTLWPTGGHDAWTKATSPAYKENNMNMYEWMLQYTRIK
ncbi:hypothetical protein D3H65_31380 [Paraflavitalea soli]|uniref:Phospholipase/carboxylesterase/thioesterase domain-containing protein n=1 Tax=Paraflavitalea soli TaxID=2315862 RepID=A0A3B7MVV4_9BACT|nr:dienelactone hydrolase family protein [Paraflavitalea soli]AXY78228.1 hypothetical protein D3H65_31380 [Paraflavitalea soli]